MEKCIICGKDYGTDGEDGFCSDCWIEIGEEI